MNTRVVDVLQVVTSTDRRGAERVAVELGPALTERGLVTETVALSAGSSTVGFDLPVLGERPVAWRTLTALRSRASTARVVVAHGSRTLPACALALMGSRVPFVYRNIGDPRQWATTPLQRLRTGIFLHRARAVVALTPRAADEIRGKYLVGAGRLRVIPSGISPELHQPSDDRARQIARDRLGLDRDVVVAATLGALSPEKSVDLAIDAVARLRDVHLLIAGDGPLRAQLEVQAASAAPGRVHFTGALPDAGLAYASADLVLMTSRTEGLPAVLIEAGFRGLPCVATDVGFVRDIVVDGETGVLAPAGDVIAIADGLRRVLASSDDMGAAARAHCAERFEFTDVADRWKTLLERVARDGRGRA